MMQTRETTANLRITALLIVASVCVGTAAALALQSPLGLKAALPVLVLPPLLLAVLIAGSRPRRYILSLRWWHALWALLLISGLTLRVRGVEQIQENPADPAALFRIGLVCTVAAAVLLKGTIGRGGLHRNLSRGLVAPLTCYALFGVFSTIWSVYPAWTLYRSVEYLVDIALIATIIGSLRSAEDYKRFFDWTWILFACLLGSVWLGVLLRPDEAIRHGVGVTGIQIHGVFPVISENGTGDLGAILAAVAIGRLLFTKENRKLFLALLLVSLATLVLAYSRTPLTAFFLAVMVMLYAGRRLTLLTALLAGMGIAGVSPLGQFLWEFFRRGQSMELFFSLSGRVYWWEYLWDVFRENPIFGLGAYAGGRFVVLDALGAGLSSSVHNTFLEVVIGSGLVGLVILLAGLGGTWWHLLRANNLTGRGTLEHYLTIEALGLLTIETFRAFFTSGPVIWHPAIRFLLVIGYAEFLRQNLKNKTLFGQTHSLKAGVE
ncbi:MAG: O-antigen ligase family protein [Bacillota bacterium]